MRAIGYLRVSTDEQRVSGLGLEAQRSSLAAAAKRLGLELAQVHADEGLSGSLPPAQRPGLMAALVALGKGDVLLVAKRDRLARDVLEVGLLERELRRKRARVVSAAGEGTESDDPSSLLQRGIVDLFAEHERQMIRARTKAALRAKRARGERAGALPFGFALGADGKLVDVPEEQVALLLMKTHRLAGESLRAIARLLTERGYRPRGRAWHASSVRSIIETDARRRS